jgi:hypothetical protein
LGGDDSLGIWGELFMLPKRFSRLNRFAFDRKQQRNLGHTVRNYPNGETKAHILAQQAAGVKHRLWKCGDKSASKAMIPRILVLFGRFVIKTSQSISKYFDIDFLGC